MWDTQKAFQEPGDTLKHNLSPVPPDKVFILFWEAQFTILSTLYCVHICREELDWLSSGFLPLNSANWLFMVPPNFSSAPGETELQTLAGKLRTCWETPKREKRYIAVIIISKVVKRYRRWLWYLKEPKLSSISLGVFCVEVDQLMSITFNSSIQL